MNATLKEDPLACGPAKKFACDQRDRKNGRKSVCKLVLPLVPIRGSL